jgi:chromate transporter
LLIGWVASAFKGIQVCVVFLILSAGVKMLKKMKKKPFNLIVMSATFLCMVAFGVFAVSFSSIFYILISGFVGLLIYLIGYFKSKKSPEQKEGEQ